MKAQDASLPFTLVFAALVAIINTKLPASCSSDVRSGEMIKYVSFMEKVPQVLFALSDRLPLSYHIR